jgi:hypothetical protein
MSRNTLRKRIIGSVLSERGAMLLDELRWLVLERELGGKLRVISDAQATSFARTVRDYMPEVCRWNVPLDGARHRSTQLITAMAVYRLRDRTMLKRFLTGKAPTAIYEHVVERYGGYRVHYFHQVDLHAPAGGPLLQRVTIPASHQALVVGMGSRWTYDQVLATATWEVVE